MKLFISTIILSLVSTLTLASGDHSHKHDDESSMFAVGEPASQRTYRPTHIGLYARYYAFHFQPRTG